MDFIPIQSFDNYIEAQMVLGRMGEEGINCWLKDENVVTIIPILSNAVGGIKLMVADDQIEKAVELLNYLQDEKRKYFTCPYCTSNNIERINSSRKTVNWITSIFTWLLGSYAIAVQQVWHCFNCDKEFEEPAELKSQPTYNED